MSWLTITIGAYFLNAIAITIDKFLLTKRIPNPAVYTFFICALSIIALGLAPWGLAWYGLASTAVALVAGMIFAASLWTMFAALERAEASRVTPIIGGLQPIIIAVLAWLFLAEALSVGALAALALVIAGTIMLSWQAHSQGSRASLYLALASAALFAISYVLTKGVFADQNFISGFIWTRIGAFIGALLLLIIPANRRDVMTNLRGGQSQTGMLFLVGQAAGAISFILVNYAISLAESVALVNALQGVQFVFLFIMTTALSLRFPHIISEDTRPRVIIQKLLGLGAIIGGIIILFMID